MADSLGWGKGKGKKNHLGGDKDQAPSGWTVS